MRSHLPTRWQAALAALIVLTGLSPPASRTRLQGADPADNKTPAAEDEAPKPRPRLVRKASARVDGIDLLVHERAGLRRWHVRVEVDGEAVESRWDAAFAKIVAFADVDKSGTVDRAESTFLPSAFALRQVLWGRFLASPAPPKWDALDLDGNGQANLEEVADYYRHHGLGAATVGLGKPPTTALLTQALAEQLKLGDPGFAEESRWKSRIEALRTLDRDADDLISPSELIGRTAYPGAWASILVQPPREDQADKVTLKDASFLLLPQRMADGFWATSLVEELDRDADGKLTLSESQLAEPTFAALDANKDGKLIAPELAELRRQPPDLTIVVRLDSSQAAEGKPTVKAAGIDVEPKTLGDWQSISQTCLVDRPGYSLHIRVQPGTLAERWDAQQRKWDQAFTQLDAEKTGRLLAADLSVQPQPPDQLFQLELGDRNRDRALDREELKAWLEVQAAVVRSHAMLSILDYGRGAFELADFDHDGALSLPELARARERFRTENDSGAWNADRLPRQVRWTVSLGRPETLLRTRSTQGPAWYLAMDRNGDGRLTQAEFAGSVEDFKRLDRDGDGQLSIEEASSK